RVSRMRPSRSRMTAAATFGSANSTCPQAGQRGRPPGPAPASTVEPQRGQKRSAWRSCSSGRCADSVVIALTEEHDAAETLEVAPVGLAPVLAHLLDKAALGVELALMGEQRRDLVLDDSADVDVEVGHVRAPEVELAD